LHEYLIDFPGKQDVLRYVLTANAPETKDNNFTWRDFQERNNSELVAIYGNFVNRALQLTKKYFGGVVPACGELTDVDREALQEMSTVKERIEQLLDQFKFREAQREAMNLARLGNKYITDGEPWKLWKQVDASLVAEAQKRRDDGTLTPAALKKQQEANAQLCQASEVAARVATILNVSLQMVANLSIAFDPFLPFSSNKLRKMIDRMSYTWDELGGAQLLPEGKMLMEPQLLFEKIEDDAIQAQLDRLERIRKENEAAQYKAEPVKPVVSFDDFEKLDIRVGRVLTCEKVKKSKKLLQFSIDDGSGTPRTILSGIAQWWEPEQLVGKDVLFIANFEPRKIMGIESQGMILSAVDHDGSLAVTSLLREVKPGSQVG
jgi:methionyl-tRNA synthetase